LTRAAAFRCAAFFATALRWAVFFFGFAVVEVVVVVVVTVLRWGGAGVVSVVVVVAVVVVVGGGGAAAGGRSALTQPMRKRVPVANPACARVKRSSSASLHQRNGAAAAPASIVPGRSRTPQVPIASVEPGGTVAVVPLTSSPFRFGRSFQPAPSPEAGTRSA
jgi:hypothetical protein